MNGTSAAERMERARVAQRSWASSPLKQRVKTLTALRRRIADCSEEIVQAIVADVGKPPLDALSAEVLVTLEQMRFYEKQASRLLRARRIKKPPVLFRGCSFYESVEPHGVALVYAPANYPFQLAMVPAITALFAGNSVVLKVSERTPSVADVIRRVCCSVLPADLLQISAESLELARQYVEACPDFIFFTGSSENGRDVAARAAARLIPTVLELGGKDPAIVFADCNLERTVEGVVYGAFANAGQVCVGIKRLYVERSIYQEFVDRLRARCATLRIGTDADRDLGTLQFGPQRDRLSAQVQDALDRGANLETTADWTVDAPVVLTNVSAESLLLSEESFGPVLCVSSFSSEEEAIALANNSAFALSASVWTNDIRRGRRVAACINAGTCAINDVIRNIANPFSSFGGNRSSGHGRYHGPEGLRTFSRLKNVMTVRPRRMHELHWFPFTEKTRRQLGAWIDLRHSSRGLLRPLRRLLCFVILASALSSAQMLSQGDLILQVHLPRGRHGSVAYAVYRSPDGFPNEKSKAVRHGFTGDSGTGTLATIDVGHLPPGTYAVSAYLDENGNHKLDSRVFGIPKEPVGASNNPRERVGPPRFSECAFQFGDADLTLPINLVIPR